MTEAGTKLVETGNGLVSIDVAEQHLATLAEAGDTDALAEVAAQASAHSTYERRMEHAERSRHFARLKVMAEAQIGALDIQRNPKGNHAGLVLAGREIRFPTVGQWRAMGYALRMGRLQEVIDQFPEELEITTSGVATECRRQGFEWVSVHPFRKRFKELTKNDGWTLKEFCRQHGLPYETVRPVMTNALRKATDRKTKPQQVVKRATAERLIGPLGLDENALRPCPLSWERAKKPKFPPRRGLKLVGGRLDETYSLLRKTLQELDRSVGQEGKYRLDEAYALLYEAEEIIGKALRRV